MASVWLMWQARPRIFDLEVNIPEGLYEEVVEVDEEVILPLSDEPDRWVLLLHTPPLCCIFRMVGGMLGRYRVHHNSGVYYSCRQLYRAANHIASLKMGFANEACR